MFQALNDAGFFLINSLFDLYLMALGVRLILAYSRANYFNPITRFIITITQPIIAPLRSYIPNYRQIETATLLFMILFAVLKYLLLSAIFYSIPSLFSLFLAGIFNCFKMILSIFFYAILLGAILSFVTRDETPLTQVLSQLAAPIIRPLQKILPPIGGIDWSPIPALLVLQIAMRIL